MLGIFLLLVCLSKFGVMAFVLSYYIVYCYVLLLSPRSLFLLSEYERISRSIGEERWRGTGRSRERAKLISIYYMKKESTFNKKGGKFKLEYPYDKTMHLLGITKYLMENLCQGIVSLLEFLASEIPDFSYSNIVDIFGYYQ